MSPTELISFYSEASGYAVELEFATPNARAFHANALALLNRAGELVITNLEANDYIYQHICTAGHMLALAKKADEFEAAHA